MNYRAQGLSLAFAIHETEFILTVSQILYAAFGKMFCLCKKMHKNPSKLTGKQHEYTWPQGSICVCELGL